MGGPTAHVSLNYWRKKQNTIASTCSMYLTNQQQFSMLCTIINHRNDIIIFKTQVKPFWHHWLSLWSIRVQTIEHFCWFVFYNNIRSLTSISVENFWQVVWRMRKRKANCAIMLFWWSVLLSNVGFHQSMHKKLDSYCKKSCRNVYHYFLLCIL